METSAISSALTAVFAAMLGIAGGIIVERWRARDERRRWHTDDIRANVLDPLLKRVESYCIPIAQGSLSPIEIERTPETKPTGVYEAPYEAEERFVTLKSKGFEIFGGFKLRDESYGLLNRVLYDDAKHTHLKKLMKQYEDAEAELLEFQTKLAKEAEWDIQQLSKTLALPV